MQSAKKWLAARLNLLGIMASIIMFCAIFFLMISNYRSGRELQKSNFEQFKADMEKQASAVSYFLAERHNDLKNMAESRAVTAFFENEALGMSMMYGLKASIQGIADLFDHILAVREIDSHLIYTRLAFFDSSGHPLVDRGQKTADKSWPVTWPRQLESASVDIKLIAEKGQVAAIMLSVPYLFKDQYAGQIVALISPWAICRFLESAEGTSKRAVYIVSETPPLFLSTTAQAVTSFETLYDWPSWPMGTRQCLRDKGETGASAEKVALRLGIARTPFSLVTTVPLYKLHGHTDSLRLSLAMGMLALMLLASSIVAHRINARNLVLKARLEESSKRENEIREKRRQLEEEVVRRRQVEDKLREAHHYLERRVAERTAELAAANHTLQTEIIDRKQAQETLLKSEERLRTYNRVITDLSKLKLDQAKDLERAFKTYTEAAARTLNVERVSIWRYVDNHSKITCVDLFLLSLNKHSNGGELLKADYPNYFYALKEDRIIAAHNALTNLKTEAFAESFLKPLHITSLLDTPLRVSGQTVGVVCHEHTGPARRWTTDEQTFAASIADLVSLAIEAAERQAAEREKLKLQERLVRAQKMEAIGTLAGGVAHDLNNILVGVVSYPDFILTKLSEDNPLRQSIKMMQSSGKKAVAIVRDLLTLARRGVATKETINLNEIVVEYLQSSEGCTLQGFHPTVCFETDLDAELFNVEGSPVHLSKTVMNLVSNAAEAMPEGGKLTITTANCHYDVPFEAYDRMVDSGDFVLLRVADTGTGITQPDMERIFEPFYTKKVMGRSGTGLGMAVVWGTVQDHNGHIDVESEVGKGTTFTIYIPVSRKKTVTPEKPLAREDYMGQGESILVIDDVKEQREIAQLILSDLGYRVETVASGEEAVDYLTDNAVDLLLLDMIMEPGMDGLDTYREILKRYPEQKAIIASGFSETQRVKAAQDMGAGAYIRKPYSMERIGVAVQQVFKDSLMIS